MHFLLPLTGAIPALIGMGIIRRLDRRRPEPVGTLSRVAIFGALVAIPVIVVQLIVGAIGPDSPGYWNSFYTSFFVAALVEESGKLWVIMRIAWRRPEFDERMDGLVYGAYAGLGFALLENIGYLAGSESMDALIGTFIARALLSVPGHTIFTGLMGYYAAKQRFDGAGPGIGGGLALAIGLHGTFNFGLFSASYAGSQGHDALILPALLLPLAVVVGGVIWMRKAVKLAVAGDAAAGLHEPD
jgi:protease PrsW